MNQGDPAPQTGSRPQPLTGRLDRADRKVISGWALDPFAPEGRVALAIKANGEVIGRCSFRFTGLKMLAPDIEYRIEVCRESDSRQLPGSPMTIPAVEMPRPKPAPVPAPPPQTQEAVGELVGNLDSVSRQRVTGWAQDPDHPSRPGLPSRSTSVIAAGCGWAPDSPPNRDERVEIVGPVGDLMDVFSRVRLTVAPLRFGAGIKGKVLESFAAGIPCAMSAIAAEGIPLPPVLQALVAENAADMARIILDLHRDEAANAAAAQAGLALIEAEMSEQLVLDAMAAILPKAG